MRQGVRPLVVALFVVGAASAIADARPGGGGGGGGGGGSHGSTYHPSIYRSSHGSGGGDDVGAGTVIGVILGLGICVSLIIILARRAERRTIQQAAAAPTTMAWDALYAADPAFSRVAFDRQARELYKAAQRARHDAGELSKLGTQLSGPARADLAKAPGRVDTVQIDGVRVIEAGATTITCAIEAVHLRGGAALHVMSRWSFARHDGAWIVDRIIEFATGGGMNLVGMGPEVGNDRPTISDDDAIAKFLELRDAQGKIYGWDNFVERVKTVFARVTEAWNQQQPALAGELVTPEVTEYLALWLDAHARQGLINHHESTLVRHVGLAKVVREPSFDVVIVRVYAQGLDHTEQVGGTETVGGSRVEPRQYTEYWTFVRTKNAGDFQLASIVQDELYAG